ncbi:NYN domain-containing protein [Patescibacteria group bacterium]|nr:NYN domain-containing protein [Patescibacteria group bacterium]
MIKKYIQGRVSIFIDASNIYHSQKRLKWQIDFRKFLGYLKKEVNLQEIYYYTARDLSFAKQTKFLNFLEMIGYKVRSKKVKFIKDKNKEKEKEGFHKGNLDVELTMDVLETKEKYDTLILLSGDSDFEPLLQLMKMKYRKRCLVMATKHSISIELIKCAKYIDLKKLKFQIQK